MLFKVVAQAYTADKRADWRTSFGVQTFYVEDSDPKRAAQSAGRLLRSVGPDYHYSIGAVSLDGSDYDSHNTDC